MRFDNPLIRGSPDSAADFPARLTPIKRLKTRHRLLFIRVGAYFVTPSPPPSLTIVSVCLYAGPGRTGEHVSSIYSQLSRADVCRFQVFSFYYSASFPSV